MGEVGPKGEKGDEPTYKEPLPPITVRKGLEGLPGIQGDPGARGPDGLHGIYGDRVSGFLDDHLCLGFLEPALLNHSCFQTKVQTWSKQLSLLT